MVMDTQYFYLEKSDLEEAYVNHLKGELIRRNRRKRK